MPHDSLVLVPEVCFTTAWTPTRLTPVPPAFSTRESMPRNPVRVVPVLRRLIEMPAARPVTVPMSVPEDVTTGPMGPC